jgi:thiosulfate/3-mercaptopyruvate sulfurtransferase
MNTSKFLDGSWYVGKARDPRAEFATERIQGARFFDLDNISDKSSSLPHMLPSAEQFSKDVSDLGISNDDHVVVYTKENCFSAARVWWTFKAFGHRKVSIMNGGINAWKTIKGPVESGELAGVTKGSYQATLNNKMVVDWKEVLNVVETGAAQIIDTRSAGRFHGTAPEPRPGLAGGHIPGSLNLPFDRLVKEEDWTTFRSKEEIKEAIEAAGKIMGSKSIISCGTGVTACVLAFGLHLLDQDHESSPIYDGSWTEWGGRSDLPKSL